ncbi:MAG: hypothetical protein DRJ42_23000 [Deltaproteobacteria bacterium]|nr:MAG: hypothetical protein DRJ42_23000 [Deltaproteobacteria bacterium]
MLFAGCAGPDLPWGWEDAQPVESTQTECVGNPYEAHDEHIEVAGGASWIDVDYLEAHFRCDQEVEAFRRGNGASIEFLVQPVDMNPSVVTACDCLYNVTITVPGLATGDYAVSLFRRWDNLNDPNDPLLIGSASGVVE